MSSSMVADRSGSRGWRGFRRKAARLATVQYRFTFKYDLSNDYCVLRKSTVFYMYTLLPSALERAPITQRDHEWSF